MTSILGLYKSNIHKKIEMALTLKSSKFSSLQESPVTYILTLVRTDFDKSNSWQHTTHI